MKTYKIDNYIFKQIIDITTVNNRIAEISEQINTDYQNKEPVFLITLTGAMFFATELIKHIRLDCKCNIISAKSYRDNLESDGKVTINMFDCDLIGKDIILLEDIVDTGLTVVEIKKEIQKQNPTSLSIATLINKPICHNNELLLNYVGFILGEEFVVGYGLDYKGYGRNLDGIYSLQQKIDM
jgi:hypoxanthine phosphoribosyltransferase